MRKTTKAVSAILSVIILIGVMMCAPFGVSAAETYGDFKYSLNYDNTCTITEYNGSASDPTIPSEIQGHKVSEIGSCAFYGCTSLTSITIPDSVTSIGWDAFRGCTSLTNITIPDSVTSIGRRSFSGTKWEENQPDGLIYAGKVAYSYKGDMPENTEITIKSGTKGIGDGAFEGCTSLTNITIPDGVTSIGNCTFEGCTSLASITIPDSVTSIGNWAFALCTSLVNITIPNSVTCIGGVAFGDCTSLTSITIPDSVTSIDNAVFWNCTSLTSVTIPDSVTSIGSDTFSGCESLTSITIPNSVTSIGMGTFSGCKSLTSIIIPNSVIGIGVVTFAGIYTYRGTFKDCENLTIYGYENSYAQEYANENDIPFVVISGDKIFGDANGDGEITIEDATLIQKSVVGIAALDADQKALADVNGDGKVTVFDVTLIQKYIVGGYANTGRVGKPANG